MAGGMRFYTSSTTFLFSRLELGQVWDSTELHVVFMDIIRRNSGPSWLDLG